MKKRIEKLVPPGTDVRKELLNCLLLLLAEFGISLCFPVRFSNALDGLYHTVGGKKVLLEGAVMSTFNELTDGALLGLPIVLAGCIALAAVHYASFYRESRSIYLMKRIGDPLELHRRCLSVPALCLMAGLLLGGLLMGLYVLLYHGLTPAGCLPGRVPFDFWRCIL